MYTTIEADIDNGFIKGPESGRLPPKAHVLITLLSAEKKQRPKFGTRTSKQISIAPNAFDPLTSDELAEWGL